MNHEKPIFGGSFWMSRSWGLHLDQEKHLNSSFQLFPQTRCVGGHEVNITSWGYRRWPSIFPCSSPKWGLNGSGCSFVAWTPVPSNWWPGWTRRKIGTSRLVSKSPNLAESQDFTWTRIIIRTLRHEVVMLQILLISIPNLQNSTDHGHGCEEFLVTQMWHLVAVVPTHSFRKDT